MYTLPNSISFFQSRNGSQRLCYSHDDGANATTGTNAGADTGGQQTPGDRSPSGTTPGEGATTGDNSPGASVTDPIATVGGQVDGGSDPKSMGGNVSTNGKSGGAAGGAGTGNGSSTKPNSSSAGASPNPGGSQAGKSKPMGSQKVDLGSSKDQGTSLVPTPKAQSKPQPTKVTPTNVKAKSNVKAGDINPDELTEFLLGVFGILATIGGEHWIIYENEAETISKPLTSILNKMNKKRKDNVTSMMAPMLLVTAVGTIIVPRALITLATWKEKKENARIATANPNRSGGTSLQAPASNGAISSQAAGIDREYQDQKSDGYDGGASTPTVPAYLFQTLNE